MFPVVVIVLMALNSSRFLGFPFRGFSLQWFEFITRDPEWVAAFQRSLIYGAFAAPLAAALGTFAAVGIRATRFAPIIQPFLLLPMIIPVIVVAFALYPFYIQLGILGSPVGIVLAHALIAFPYAFMIVWGAIHILDRRLEQAARSLGATPWSVVVRIVLPLLSPAILGAAVVSAVVSFDETVATLFLSSPATRTVPIEIWLHIANDFSPTAAAASTVVLVLNVALMAVATTLSGRVIRRRTGFSGVPQSVLEKTSEGMKK